MRSIATEQTHARLCPALFLGLCLLAACGVPDPPDSVRLVPAGEPELLTEEKLYTAATVFDWTIRDAEDVAAWTSIRGGAPRLHDHPRGLYFDYADKIAELERRVALPAAGVHAVEVTLAYPHGAGLELLWTRRGEAFSDARRVALRPDDGRQGRDRLYTLDLRAAAEWRGEITRLRFRFRNVGGGGRVLKRVRALRYGVSPEELAEKAGRPWSVDLGHDVRTALLAPPGQPVERRLRVPAESVLRFAYGATAQLDVPVGFRVLAAGGGVPRPIFEARLAGSEPVRWREESVDLSPWGGREVRLVFETAASSPFDPAAGVPVWGNPEIVPAGARTERPNVVLISVDTLRADRLASYGYERATSPRLDAWARRSAVVFENAVVQAPWTLPSHVSMFTGLNANHHGVNYSRTVTPRALDTMGEILREAGYATAAVTGGAWLDPRFGLAQGFDQYRYWPTPGESEMELATGVEQALLALETLRRPFFLFFHTFEVHDYWLRAENADRYDAASSEIDSAELERLYDRSVSTTDEELHRLFEQLEALGLRGETLVVLTSDHGTGFGDKRPWGHGYLYDNNLRVPLIVELPDGRGRGRRIARQVRSIDILPTVLDVAGVAPRSPLDGVSLVPLADGREGTVPEVAFSYAPDGNRGVALRVGGRWKYIFNNGAWAPLHGQEELYRLRDDPGEVDDLGADHSAVAELRAAAQRFLAEVPGLRLRFANAAGSPLLFKVRGAGALINKHAVKSPGLPCDCVTSTGVEEVSVTVDPGLRFDLVFEELVENQLEIEATAPGQAAPTFRRRFHLRELERALSLRWTGSGWVLGDAGGEAASGVEIRWHGRLEPDAESPLDRDGELRRRLKALGYLD